MNHHIHMLTQAAGGCLAGVLLLLSVQGTYICRSLYYSAILLLIIMGDDSKAKKTLQVAPTRRRGYPVSKRSSYWVVRKKSVWFFQLLFFMRAYILMRAYFVSDLEEREKKDKVLAQKTRFQNVIEDEDEDDEVVKQIWCAWVHVCSYMYTNALPSSAILHTSSGGGENDENEMMKCSASFGAI